MVHPEYPRRRSPLGRAGGLLAGLLLALFGGAVALAADNLVEQGRRIYVDGVLTSGEPLTALRAGDVRGEGGSVACITCHRPSGMGQVEGDLQIRPITGNYLYHIGRKNLATMDPRIGKRMNQAHAGYTDETLARAIREGINSQNVRMAPLMPRYNLEAPDMLALQAYLKQLSANWSPGVTAKMIHFATIVTPDVEPERRKVYLDMLQGIFDQKNGSTMPGRRHMVSPAEMLGGTERNWTLHVWALEGAPETWATQLEAFNARQPVFAVLGGLSSGDWSPVADFCEQKRLPNWFPSVDYSPSAHGAYTVYFSRGVGLEADVLARALLDGEAPKGRIVQIYREGRIGQKGAEQLRTALAGEGYKGQLEDRAIRKPGRPAVRAALAGLGRGDVAVLWLTPDDLAALGEGAPAKSRVIVSGRLARGQWAKLAPAAKKSLEVLTPYLLPQEQDANLATYRIWMDLRKFPVVDDAVQSELFFAASYMTATISEMLDNLYVDYLLERVENMLTVQETLRAVDESRMRALAGKPGAMIAHYGPETSPEGIHRSTLDRMTNIKNQQTGTSIYPALSLGAGQRHASKGAYLTRVAGPGLHDLISEAGWIVP